MKISPGKCHYVRNHGVDLNERFYELHPAVPPLSVLPRILLAVSYSVSYLERKRIGEGKIPHSRCCCNQMIIECSIAADWRVQAEASARFASQQQRDEKESFRIRLPYRRGCNRAVMRRQS